MIVFLESLFGKQRYIENRKGHLVKPLNTSSSRSGRPSSRLLKEELDTLRDQASRLDQIWFVRLAGGVHVRTMRRALNVIGAGVLVPVAGQTERVPRVDRAIQQKDLVGDQVSAAVHHVGSSHLLLDVVRVEFGAVHIHAHVGEKAVCSGKRFD